MKPALPILAPQVPETPTERLKARISAVLETRPGQIPWRPEFGCDLQGLVGQPAAAEHLTEARRRVTGALARWLPDVEFTRCDVRVVAINDSAVERPRGSVPVAEHVLLSLGVQAGLEVLIEVRGPVALSMRADIGI